MVLQSGPELGQRGQAFKVCRADCPEGGVTLDKVASSATAVPTHPAAKGLLLSPNQYLGSCSLHHPLTRPFQQPCSPGECQGRDAIDYSGIIMTECSTRQCERNVINVGTPGCSECVCVHPQVYMMAICICIHICTCMYMCV